MHPIPWGAAAEKFCRGGAGGKGIHKSYCTPRCHFWVFFSGPKRGLVPCHKVEKLENWDSKGGWRKHRRLDLFKKIKDILNFLKKTATSDVCANPPYSLIFSIFWLIRPHSISHLSERFEAVPFQTQQKVQWTGISTDRHFNRQTFQ